MSRLRNQVIEFHKKYGHTIRSEPFVGIGDATKIGQDEIRFRLRLITEEWKELVLASLELLPEDRFGLFAALDHALADATVKLDICEFVDALADLDYVIEGTRVSCGVDGAPIADEVHRANMDKGPNGPNGKPTKPPGWVPPAIKECLEMQGWDPNT